MREQIALSSDAPAIRRPGGRTNSEHFAESLDTSASLLADQSRMGGMFGDDPAFGQVPPLNLPVPEGGVGRVGQVEVGALPVPHLAAGVAGFASIAATVRSVHAAPVRCGFRPGSAADGHGTPASFKARVIRAALCPASR